MPSPVAAARPAAALLMASLFSPAGKSSIVLGAEENHPLFSPRLEASVAGDAVASDGGGALIVTPAEAESGTRMKSLFFSSGQNNSFAGISAVSNGSVFIPRIILQQRETCRQFINSFA